MQKLVIGFVAGATLMIVLAIASVFGPVIFRTKAQCGDMNVADVKQTIIRVATEPGYFDYARQAYDEVEPVDDVGYSDVPRLWGMTIYLKLNGKRVARYFAMLSCYNTLEWSHDQDFKPE